MYNQNFNDIIFLIKLIALTIVHLNGAGISDSFDNVTILVTSVSTGV